MWLPGHPVRHQALSFWPTVITCGVSRWGLCIASHNREFLGYETCQFYTHIAIEVAWSSPGIMPYKSTASRSVDHSNPKPGTSNWKHCTYKVSPISYHYLPGGPVFSMFTGKQGHLLSLLESEETWITGELLVTPSSPPGTFEREREAPISNDAITTGINWHWLR